MVPHRAINNFHRIFFKLMKNLIFRKDHGECKKSQRYLACGY